MSIKTALASHLKNEPIVAEKVGADVYLQVARTNALLPYITIHRISENHVRHMTAVSGLVQATFQIDCWADNPIGAEALADVVRRSLDHLNHQDIGIAPNTATVRGAFLEGSLDDFEGVTHGTTPRIFVVHQTWTIWHTESVPTFV